MSWQMVDEGWGRRAAEFATLSEPAACREYVAMHQRLGVGPGDRLLDMSCGSGLALELAGVRGAACAGIDASERRAAVARDRNPRADIRVSDVQDLPCASWRSVSTSIEARSWANGRICGKRSTFLSTQAANAAVSRSAGPGSVSLRPAVASNSIHCHFVLAVGAPPGLTSASTR